MPASSTTTPQRDDLDREPAFPEPRSCPFHAPPTYTAFREQGGLHRVTIWDGSTPWLATRHADVRAVLADPRFSADVRREEFPLVHAHQREAEGGKFLRLDDPEHTRIRQMLTREFSVKRTRALHDDLLGVTDELIDHMLDGASSADIVSQFALPLPSRAICRILGVPYEDHELFQAHANVGTDLAATPAEREEKMAAVVEYYGELVARKQREPGEDLISRLLADHVGPDGLALEDLPGLIAILVGAGHETTANMLSLSVLALLMNPGQAEQLRDDPTKAPAAAEELLRYWSIVSTDPRRVALENVDIDGQTVRAGESVIVSLVAANRDPEAFTQDGVADPDTLDFERNARAHLAFGFGTHQCLGQNLTRVEMQVALPRLFQRVPSLRLAVDPDEVPFRTNSIVYGVTELPVAWDAS